MRPLSFLLIGAGCLLGSLPAHAQEFWLADDVPAISADTTTRIPPGPNSAVGNMWIDLSKPHYGIHGTAEPQTIGYAVSSGCVRLTNWDARFLGSRIERGIPVRFRDIPPGQREHPSHGGDSSRGASGDR